MNAQVQSFEYKTPEQRASEALAAVMDELTLEKVKAFHAECRELVNIANNVERKALLMFHDYIGNGNVEGAQKFYDLSKADLNLLRDQLKKIGGVCRGN